MSTVDKKYTEINIAQLLMIVLKCYIKIKLIMIQTNALYNSFNGPIWREPNPRQARVRRSIWGLKKFRRCEKVLIFEHLAKNFRQFSPLFERMISPN